MKKIISKIKKIFNKFNNLDMTLKIRIISIVIILFLLSFSVVSYIITYSDLIIDFNSDNKYLTSGIYDNSVIVNDLESDLYYYKGLNYTYSPNSSLPTKINKNIYNDNNLVQVKITYNGSDSNDNTGYISMSERQDQYIYFKAYPVNNNNTPNNQTDDYIDITLIDNPFTAAPTNGAFNGWITNFSGAFISYDSIYYERHAKVPVTYNNTNERPNPIEITFTASWITATVSNVQSNNFTTPINNLKERGMYQITDNRYLLPTVNGLFKLDEITTTVTVTRSGSVWNPRYNTNVNTGTCTDCYDELHNYYGTNPNSAYQCPQPTYPNNTAGTWTNTCRVYYLQDTNDQYDEQGEYYNYDQNTSSFVQTEIGLEHVGKEVLSDYTNFVTNGMNMSGFYKNVNLTYGTSLIGYYNNFGVVQTSGTCNNTNGCVYYELVQYYDNNNTPNTLNLTSTEENNYYYLATRDTNILFLRYNVSATLNTTKPLTLTSAYNNTSYVTNYYWNVGTGNININGDIRIENIRIYSTTARTNGEIVPYATNDGSTLIGNWHNVKLGRGIITYNNYVNFGGVVGGNNSSTGSNGNPTKYKLEIETGIYNSIGLSTGNSGGTDYINAKGVYGNDYDRVSGNNNLLEVRHCASGSWAGTIYGNSNSISNNDVALDLTVKSGRFGSNKYDYATGIYIGGRNGGTHYAIRKITVEGGYIYNLIGGPLTSQNRNLYNDTLMYIKGGSIDIVIGGAGRSETYGNRIIQVTGGTINYSVFGGSNGIEGSNTSNNQGTLDGDTYVYVGGTAIIGDETLVNNNTIETESQVESGSVFGIGNGRNGYEAIGSANNSTVIIDESATIRRNVYGGGNYGATGISSNSNTSATDIYIHGGIINGSVYGGGNNNGSGSNSKTSTISITMDAGNVLGSVYGGSNAMGRVYGSTNLNIYGGEIANSVYGGGRGGYTNNTNYGTFVTQNVNVTIGDDNSNKIPIINGGVYGGSAFGTVNGNQNNTTVSTYKTNVVVNKGLINNVFGGGEGNNTYTPYDLGDIKVTINDGTITKVFGGNDLKGKPNGNIEVFLNGGTIIDVFGGGNETAANTTNVYLNGATTTNIYGGSNINGDVTTSNVIATNGIAENVYGGNNQGGVTNVTNVTVNGGTISNVYGGGEQTSVSTETNVNLNSFVTNVFGGSNLSGTIPESNIIVSNGSATNLYGGNNQGGITNNSNIMMTSGNITNLYGGGLQAQTGQSNVNIINGNITNLYGGGSEAGVTTTNLNLGGPIIENVFGGSNLSGNVTTSNIRNFLGNGYNSQTGNILKITNLYGGNNQGGTTITTNVILTSGEIDTAFGGGNQAETTITNISIENVQINKNIYGGGNEADVTTANLTVGNSTIGNDLVSETNGNIFGGGNNANVLGNATVNIENNTIVYSNVYSGGNLGSLNGIVTTNIEDCDIRKSIYGGGNEGEVGLSEDANVTNLTISDTTARDVYGGGRSAAINGSTNVTISNSIITNNIYGGGNGLESQVVNDATGEQNPAKVLGNTNLIVNENTTVKNVFGGGNLGFVNNDVNIHIDSITASENVFGGGSDAQVLGNTNFKVTDCTILKNIFGGGNGIKAIVVNSNYLDVEGDTVVSENIFGGGNEADTGFEGVDTSEIVVNITGAQVGNGVYGGANRSILNGAATLNIGLDASTNNTLVKGDIIIAGTVFGGGEANRAGSNFVDFSTISVTKGTDININGQGYENFEIQGSIFGSGNATLTAKPANVYIKNYGTSTKVQKNISLQRADLMVLDNSHIMLSGTTDRLNVYSDVLFSISRVDEVKVKNGTNLYLENGGNLLKKFTSLATDAGGNEVKAVATIDDELKTVTRNTNNRLYMLEGKNLNIATDQSVTVFGDVSGMTFLGMFLKDGSGNPITALYKPTYDYGSEALTGDLYYFTKGSYVLGRHYVNHNIEVDGFYSNYADADNEGYILTKYITPTPDDSDFYMWVVGEPVISYEVDLTASKYSTLGVVEFNFLNFSDSNTKFNILGANYAALEEGVQLVSKDDIPRIAANPSDADNIMGLSIKTGQNGWITVGETEFLSEGSQFMTGTSMYESENSTSVPSFLFYLYHSKNLQTAGRLGTVTISMVVITPIDDLNNNVERINFNINLSRALYTTDEYEASLSPGKKYEMFASTPVNITTNSSFSAYYSLFMNNDISPYQTGYHRVLTSSYVFPVNTKITMIDYTDENLPIYYYYVVTEDDYVESLDDFSFNNEVSYELSKFIKMGSKSVNNNYNDEISNQNYYKTDTRTAEEEFVFIVDLSESNIEEDAINNKLLLELRNSNNQTLISVLGIQQETMSYNLYANKSGIIEVSNDKENIEFYNGTNINLNLSTNFIQQTIGSNIIFDTNFDDQKLGLKISIYDKDNNLLPSSNLLGIYFENNGIYYYPRYDGTTRINIAPRIANVSSRIILHAENSNLAGGNYRIVIESFGSADGIYYGLESSDTLSLNLKVMDTLYGLKMEMNEKSYFIDKTTGENLLDSNTLNLKVKYQSGLENPNLRIKLLRRLYDSVYSNEYETVDILDYVSNYYNETNNQYEYYLSLNPVAETDYFIYTKNDLMSGTYKLEVLLYDDNVYVGSVFKYIIIK